MSQTTTTRRRYTRHRYYQLQELRYCPIEHVLEALTCRELARALGCGKSAAWDLKRGAATCENQDTQRIRAWLDRSEQS